MTPDFLIIGAQKSGTTSLFKALASNRGIFMPQEKEVQFFNRDNFFYQGIEAYEEVFFRKKRDDIIGEASPQYLANKIAAERITTLCPGTKIIVILRNPVDRAYSHYRMTYRRGRTTNTFEEDIAKRFIKPYGTPENPDMDRDYLLLGEYGRQLLWYKKYFKKRSIKVIFLDSFENNPGLVLEELQNLLGISELSLNSKLIHENKGGEGKYNRLRNCIYHNMIVRYAARIFIPPQKRRSILFWLENSFFVKPVKQIDIEKKIRFQLESYFSNDTILLEKLLGKPVPWRYNELLQKN